MSRINLIIQQDEEDIEAAEVLVDVTVGTNKYRFLLDTGAARTSMVFDDYTGTFDSLNKSDSSGVFARSSDDLITVPSFDLGPISKKNLTVSRVASNSPGMRNLVGMDVLKDFCCHFLFEENGILVDPSGVSGSLGNVQELTYDGKFHPYVDVWLGRVRAKAVWDTGAGITIADTNLINKHPALFEEVGRSHGTDSTGFRMETPMFIMAATIIGNHEFPPLKVAGVDLSQVNSTIDIPMDLILGYNTLSKANWFFDFPGKKWAITKLLSD
ncbi:MAG TPA: hypothetical protein VEX13_06120 [Chloroflexia bacterium]|nr:hypothetical protein [Chloroflexia bacterium]